MAWRVRYDVEPFIEVPLIQTQPFPFSAQELLTFTTRIHCCIECNLIRIVCELQLCMLHLCNNFYLAQKLQSKFTAFLAECHETWAACVLVVWVYLELSSVFLLFCFVSISQVISCRGVHPSPTTPNSPDTTSLPLLSPHPSFPFCPLLIMEVQVITPKKFWN